MTLQVLCNLKPFENHLQLVITCTLVCPEMQRITPTSSAAAVFAELQDVSVLDIVNNTLILWTKICYARVRKDEPSYKT